MRRVDDDEEKKEEENESQHKAEFKIINRVTMKHVQSIKRNLVVVHEFDSSGIFFMMSLK